MLADAIADQLTKEMRDRRLGITVNSPGFEAGAWRGSAALEFAVKFGNGKTKSYTAGNASPNSVLRVYDGAPAQDVS
jgi:hypothetical protein